MSSLRKRLPEIYTICMTQYEIAKRLGISEQAVSKWYTGQSLPSTANLIALSKLLGKDMETLIKNFTKLRKARKR